MKTQTATLEAVSAARRRRRSRFLRSSGKNFIAALHPGLRAQHAFSETHDAAGARGGHRIARHHDDGLVQLAMEVVEQREDLARGFGVEVSGRLVGQEQWRVADESARDGHPLLLTAG